MFLRLKDRAPPIQPSGEVTKKGVISERKKVVPVEESTDLEYSPEEEENAPSKSTVPFYFGHTQKKRIEKVYDSDEMKYRYENAPCIQDMLEIRSVYLKEKAREEKEKARKNRRKKELEEQQKRLDAALKSGKLDEIDDLEETVEDDDDPEDEELKMLALVIKERRICTQRQSYLVHTPLSKSAIFFKALRSKLFFPKRSQPYTYVLPWLILGRGGDITSNSNILMKLGITHIMNVTKDIPNSHPGRFVYQRIPIDDSTNVDGAAKFAKAIAFIKRVANCRGKLYVHCNAGASRAPLMVLAYLVKVRKLSLFDAFYYLQCLRPAVCPNRHFLFQLAELEIAEGKGSSVLYVKEFRNFEFNSIITPNLKFRKKIGLFQTTYLLHTQENAHLDFVSE